VVERADAFEIRDYAPHLVAETVVEGSLEDAGNRAFGRLFGYISGRNRAREKVAMTAPVTQEPPGEQIAMTAPVGQRPEGERWAVSFMMPARYTLETLPVPLDPQVSVRLVPARRMAAMRYTGRWSERGYQRHLDELEAWIGQRGLVAVGEPAWARYDAPFIPWFMRRNEILIAVTTSDPS
jgi:hypothetical protein